MQVYFDNAATTPMDVAVIERMTSVMRDIYGNPSAIHALGRKARAEIELARRSIAEMLHCSSNEIYFTGSGTEADNMALRCAVSDLGVKVIITSAIEHKAVLDTAKDLEVKGLISLLYVKLDSFGRADLYDLEQLAMSNPGALISLMHGNNEIGTLNDIEAISGIAQAHSCYFHTDTVQTMGHYPFDLNELGAHFITCSAHKFHGPKGVGFLYKRKSVKVKPMITGGGQESKLRAGTENVIGIIGLAEALKQAYSNLDEDMAAISSLKQYIIEQLVSSIPNVAFNGDISPEGGLYTVLNVSIPPYEGDSALLYQLDMEGICISGGSACNSGAIGSSHVLEGIHSPEDRTAVRMSFSKLSTKAEADFVLERLASIIMQAQTV